MNIDEGSRTSDTSSNDSKTPTKWIPQRYLVSFMIFLASVNSFINRDVLIYTITYFAEIKYQKQEYHNSTIGQHCEVLKEYFHETLPNATTTKLTKIEQPTIGKISSLLFVTYLPLHIFGGIYSDRRSPKRVISLSTILSSIINISTPLLIQVTKGNVSVLMVLRLLMGGTQGAHLPAASNLIAHWAPLRERAFLSSISVSGLYIGLIARQICTSFLVDSTGNWSTPYYVYGSIGIVVALIWEFYVFANPEKDPRITPEEKEYLASEMKGLVDHRHKEIPYRAILSSFQIWILIMAFSANRWIGNFFALTLPEYTKEVLKYNTKESSLISSLPFLPMTLILLIFGLFSDWVVRNGHINLITIRKIFSTLGMMGPPIYMLTGSFAGCNRFAAVLMFILALSLMVFVFLGLYLVTLDLGPNYTGFTSSLTNGLGNISGIFLGKVIERVAPDKTVLQYRKLFWLSMGIAVVTNTVYMVFGTTKLQAWNKPVFKRK
ncbi:sialin-like [Tribolium madens]|uniref:sialin-like n=1 Tax=Tribolium madens TaxID=41895 RepID=UPI001CF7440B|nr:sialin-like [Tribolium madens]